jgi:FkbM family methyltransferase
VSLVEKARRGTREWVRHAGVGFRLGKVAANPRSRVALAYLGLTAVFRSRGFWRGGPVPVDIVLGGKRYPVRLHTRTELDVLEEVGIDDEYGSTDEIAAKTIVDLGAHVGLATLRLLAKRPGAKAIAVEADPVLIPRLRENLAGLPVEIVHAAIGPDVGERDFYRSDISSWGNSLEKQEWFQDAVKVPTTTLDALLDAQGIEAVDLLKVDIEGAEWELFAADPQARAKAIVGEVHARKGRAPHELVDRLATVMQVRMISDEPWGATFVATRGPGAENKRS